MSGDENMRRSRRTVLQKLAGTAAVGAGLGFSSGTASAIETHQRLTRHYQSEDVLRTAFESHADGVVATLREEGLVGEAFALDSLSYEVDAAVEGLEPTATDAVAGATSVEREGTFTALGMVSTSSDTHEISLYVQPQREEAYAFVEAKDGEESLIVDESGVKPQGCSWTDCGTCCSEGYEEKVTYNCDPNCQDCHVYERSCGCSADYCG